MPIRVLLADDQVLTRQGLRALLSREPDIEVVAEASSGQEAVQLALRHRPDVVLMDIVMEGEDGIEATRAIKQSCPHTQILILTVYADQELFRRAVRAGAVGYVLKDISPQNLVNAIRAVYSGKTMVNPGILRQLVEDLYRRAEEGPWSARRMHGLTDREVDVLLGVASGLSDKEIAARLFLAESTVKTHLRSIYQKLGVRNRAQAAAWAVERGLVQSGPPSEVRTGTEPGPARIRKAQ
ncbi:MAG: response regulator transcription factor [Armatimonadetes bacterium]|nr:response regulator transcription factor [Armatimonadota bacterium]MDW8153872.1 response regulator transcription factor [Armatimonadota bacterium]